MCGKGLFCWLGRKSGLCLKVGRGYGMMLVCLICTDRDATLVVVVGGVPSTKSRLCMSLFCCREESGWDASTAASSPSFGATRRHHCCLIDWLSFNAYSYLYITVLGGVGMFFLADINLASELCFPQCIEEVRERMMRMGIWVFLGTGQGILQGGFVGWA